jgi:2,3-bisphosphoglycerate-independent phosphoglycerate mutase
MDGASDWPLPERGDRTCLELAHTPNLDAIAREGTVGLARTVPPGMEASSACACMSVLGYDPRVYYSGRGPIEAKSMGIHLEEGEAAFRCNLVALRDGRMWSYSSGQISNSEAHALVSTLQERLGSEEIHFYPGVGYRHLCTIRGHEETLRATCTPPHDISGQPIDGFLPHGPGSELLRELMARSQEVLRDHPVNRERVSRGDIPATSIWLFWGGGPAPDLPPFKQTYGLDGAMTSGVDLLRGLAQMAGMRNLDIPGVSAGLDNDYAAQAAGAIQALGQDDLVVIHIEAPDEAAHDAAIDDKIEAIERIDREVVGRFLSWGKDSLRLLVLPDHPTPIETRTHAPDPVPFVLWGPGLGGRGKAKAYSEAEARGSGLFVEEGHSLMVRLVSGEGPGR